MTEAAWAGGPKESSFYMLCGVGRLPRPQGPGTGCGNRFLPGPVGLRDSRNAGPRAWRRANAIRPISDLEAQIWKFEEAQPALPNCKETRLRRVMGRWQ